MGYCSDGSSQCLTIDDCACAPPAAVFERRDLQTNDCGSNRKKRDCDRAGPGCTWTGSCEEVPPTEPPTPTPPPTGGPTNLPTGVPTSLPTSSVSFIVVVVVVVCLLYNLAGLDITLCS